MDYRLRLALFVVGLTVAISVGVVLGDGHPTVRHSHMLAFATNQTLCAGGQALCAGLFILDGDSVPQDARVGDPLPAAAKLLAPGRDIFGPSWSPNAKWIAYLVGRRGQIAGNYYLIDSVDLWRVHVADERNELIAKDVASGQEDREYRLELAILWLGDRPVMAGKQSWSPVKQEPGREFLAPDKKLVARRGQGIDSNWICVRPPQPVRLDPAEPGCFGVGFFTEPVWAPF